MCWRTAARPTPPHEEFHRGPPGRHVRAGLDRRLRADRRGAAPGAGARAAAPSGRADRQPHGRPELRARTFPLAQSRRAAARQAGQPGVRRPAHPRLDVERRSVAALRQGCAGRHRGAGGHRPRQGAQHRPAGAGDARAGPHGAGQRPAARRPPRRRGRCPALHQHAARLREGAAGLDPDRHGPGRRLRLVDRPHRPGAGGATVGRRAAHRPPATARSACNCPSCRASWPTSATRSTRRWTGSTAPTPNWKPSATTWPTSCARRWPT